MVRLRSIGLVAAVVVGLSGCAAQPTASPAPPSPSSDPHPGAPAVVEITADGFRVLDAAGTELDEIALGDDYQPVVAALSDAIGAEPVVSEWTLEDSCKAGTYYTWDDKVWVFFYEDQRLPPFPRTELTVIAQTEGQVAFRADAGFAVGSDAAPLTAGLPADQVSTENGAFVWDKLADVVDGGGETRAFGAAAIVQDGAVSALMPKATILSGYGC